MNSNQLISIIIPTLNEEQNIASLLESLRSNGESNSENYEIIIVDGGSSDRTAEQCGAADKFIQSPPGRATQQNAGVKESQGDILLFLHADCRLEPRSLASIREMLADNRYSAGCFRQQIDHPSWKYRLLEWGNRQRVRWGQSAYGDQGIFVTRNIFEQASGFPEVPFLEDLLLMKKLRRLGKIGILDKKIIISPRRWQKTGVFRQTIINRLFVVLAHLGVSPRLLAKYYPEIR